jgi:hypothetical protein
MDRIKYLPNYPLHEIIQYTGKNKTKDCIAFTGTPKKHPYDEHRIVLVVDPFSSHTNFFEFNISDIAAVEEIPSLATEEGTNVKMVKVWVKKGSIGMKYELFTVDDTLTYIHDSEVLYQKENKTG